ncbi:transcription initiation factor TFIID subunit 9-like isoform X2 [Syzygium oleosum]|uniref:transcription initiation factor TFIID subunit 9-like isoform X2 n=1 Tax=Syzygium oleosum TaxID=219896 RepID=UPI0024BB440F|nr:transcription initiation factor TFIID subunit 9-like isoform X2 [Syzygium oleosum]
MHSLFDAADYKREMAEKDEDLQIPRDAKIIKSLLQSIGIEEYEPRVVHHMLELWYKYAGDVLTDAQLYSEHAGKGLIDSDDIKLAIQSRVNFTFSQPPPRGVLLELAKNRNKIPLPRTVAGPGTLLPPELDTLIFPNYQLAIPEKQSLEELEQDEVAKLNPSLEHSTESVQHTHQRVSFSLSKQTK